MFLECLKYISKQKEDQIYSVHLVPELTNMILIEIVLGKSPKFRIGNT